MNITLNNRQQQRTVICSELHRVLQQANCYWAANHGVYTGISDFALSTGSTDFVLSTGSSDSSISARSGD